VSKRRAIITAVAIEGVSQAEAARRYGVSKGWVSKLVNQYRTLGDEAFEPRSRRPYTSPNKTPTDTVELIVKLRDGLVDSGHDAGPETLAWHLETDHNITVSPSTIRRYLIKAGRIDPEPKKRPRSSYIRFVADLPNETWQSDVTHYFLGRPDPMSQDNRAEILTWLDDHSRYALSVTAHLPVDGDTVVEALKTAGERYGFPASILSDNGFIYTTRFVSDSPNALETYCTQQRIHQKHSGPYRPTTCGKVERFQQTLKNWLRAQPHQPTTITQLQALCDTFVAYYNTKRPHRSLNRRTPQTAYHALPKAVPASQPETPIRVRHDTVDPFGKVTLRRAGRLHHIGIGRRHSGTPITLIIEDLDIRIINTQTGELLRTLTLNPNHDYQPQNTQNP
jgi:transposase InsO family protein